MHRRYLAFLLVLSGTCGLAYELIWVRMLSLSFGSTTLSFSTVIAVFLGGLALGAWLCGRSKRALARPVVTYAVLELATGVIGLLSFPVLRALPEAFSYIDPGAGARGLIARLAISTLVLLPPTLLMGATLPAACAACVHDDAKLGSGTAILYGLNTLGACLGTYTVTFVLFPRVGLDGAVYTTVAINIFVGLVALTAERLRFDVHATEGAAAAAVPSASGVSRGDRRPYVLAFLAGMAAVAAQVVWSRLFSVLLSGTIYGVGSVLVAILIGIGVGSLIASRTLKTGEQAARAFVVTHVILLGSLLAFWWALPWLEYEIQVVAFGLKGYRLVHAQLAIVVATVGIPAAASGAVLPILVRVVAHRAAAVPGALSRLYAFNTVGSVLGSLLGGFMLLPLLGTAGTAYLTTILVALTLALGAIALLTEAGAGRYLVALLAVSTASAFPEIDAIRIVTPLKPAQNVWDHGGAAEFKRAHTKYFHEGQVATVLVTEEEMSRGLTLNGLGQGLYAFRPPHYVLESLLVAEIPVFHAARSSNALIVGLGAGATVDAMLEMGVEHIRVIELEPAVLTAQAAIFGRPPPTEDPRVVVTIDDARHYLLLNARSQERFDIITSMPAHPWVAANVFTREFFDIARANLTSDGVFTAWFGRGAVDDEVFASLVRGFAAAFPHHVIYDIPEVSAFYFVGSPSPIALDPTHFERVATTRAVLEAAEPVAELRYFLRRVLAAGGSEGDGLLIDTPVNTDLTIFAETHGPLARGSTLTPSKVVDGRGFDPRLVAEHARAAMTEQLLEDTLGTPDGRLPSSRTGRVDVDAVGRLLERAREVLDAEAVRYFTARAAAARSPSPQVIAALDEVAVGGGRFATRAATHAASLEPNAELRRERVRKLIASGSAGSDVWLRALDGPLRDAAVEAATSSTIAPATDPLGWLIAASSGARLDVGPDRAAVIRQVGPLLRGAPIDPLIDVCSAASAHVPVLARMCQEQERGRRLRGSRRAIDDAIAAGRRGDLTRALDSFERAHTLEPLDARTLDLYFRTAVYVGDDVRQRQAADELRLRGMPAIVEADRIREARIAAPVLPSPADTPPN